MEFGINTFGDISLAEDGRKLSHAQVIRNVVAEAELAEQVGLDSIGLGEHHRDDFAISSPEVVLAAIAARTSRIRLRTAVTVLGADDPVRLFERFATLDAVARGRAEITLGRGSFTEPFPLFGYELDDYDRLFNEKFDLMVKLLSESAVTWSGSVRTPLSNQELYPKTESGHIRTWVAVGGTPAVVVRAAQNGLPLVLAVLTGDPAGSAPLVELYRRALGESAQPHRPVVVHSHGFVAETDEEAVDTAWPHLRAQRDRMGSERGLPPFTRERFEEEVQSGALFLGSPETVAQKIAKTVSSLGIQGFDLKYSTGTLPHGKLMKSIELYGTRVVPRVRELLA
jgi:probable LLM family oxidoreductase